MKYLCGFHEFSSSYGTPTTCSVEIISGELLRVEFAYKFGPNSLLYTFCFIYSVFEIFYQVSIDCSIHVVCVKRNANHLNSRVIEFLSMIKYARAGSRDLISCIETSAEQQKAICVLRLKNCESVILRPAWFFDFWRKFKIGPPPTAQRIWHKTF